MSETDLYSETDELEEMDPLDSSEPVDYGAQIGTLGAQYNIPEAAQAFELLSSSSKQARQALADARAKILARKYNSAIPLLAASAALGAPTRAGSTAESFANMSGALVGPLQQKDEFERQQAQDILGIDTNMAGLDERLAQSQLSLASLKAKLASADAIAKAKIDAAQANVRPVLTKVGDKYYWKKPSESYDKEGAPPQALMPNLQLLQQPQPGGTVQPTVFNPRTGETRPTGESYRPVSKLSGSAMMQAKGKLQTTAILRKQLANIRETYEAIKETASAGPYWTGQGIWATEAGKKFDKAVDAARTTVRQLTRTPGEGSMSDWEGKLAQAQMPERTNWESVTDQAIGDLEELAAGYEATTRDMIGDTPPMDDAPILKFDNKGNPIK